VSPNEPIKINIIIAEKLPTLNAIGAHGINKASSTSKIKKRTAVR
jgi:hypothetical protein